jgi:Cu/Zn superoxide dismutase
MIRHCVLFLLGLLLLCPPAGAAQKARAVARLASLQGKPLGTVEFSALSHGVLITFDLHDLPPGAHGIHLHTAGNCDAKTGFTAAGPILSCWPASSMAIWPKADPGRGICPTSSPGPTGASMPAW